MSEQKWQMSRAAALRIAQALRDSQDMRPPDYERDLLPALRAEGFTWDTPWAVQKLLLDLRGVAMARDAPKRADQELALWAVCAIADACAFATRRYRDYLGSVSAGLEAVRMFDSDRGYTEELVVPEREL